MHVSCEFGSNVRLANFMSKNDDTLRTATERGMQINRSMYEWKHQLSIREREESDEQHRAKVQRDLLVITRVPLRKQLRLDRDRSVLPKGAAVKDLDVPRNEQEVLRAFRRAAVKLK
jgi:hypothetical protein